MNRIDLTSAAGSPFFWKRAVLTFVFFSLLWYVYSGMMVHDVYDSPFHYKGADLTYWLFYWIGLSDAITSSYTVSLSFSILLLFSFLCSIVFIRNRSLTILAGLLLLIYQVVFNARIGYHTHHLYGMQFALLPFYFGPRLFASAAGFSRLLACTTYFMAGAFKVAGKAWAEMGSFSNTLQNQHGAYLYFEPDTLRSQFVGWLSSHPETGWAVFVFAMLLQLSFLAGLMTRKFDLWLALFIVGFHVMDWFLMNLGVFMSMTVLVWLFLFRERAGQASVQTS